MGTLKIGGRELAVARPDDLAARVLASSGLNMDEAERLLVRSRSVVLVTRAILPLLIGDDRPTAAELGELVGSDDLAAIGDQVAPFYQDQPTVEVEHGEA